MSDPLPGRSGVRRCPRRAPLAPLMLLVTVCALLAPRVAAGAAGGAAGAVAPAPPPAVDWTRTLDQRDGEFPTGFERNDGQAPPPARFLVHDGPYPVALTATGVSLRLPSSGAVASRLGWRTVGLELGGALPAAALSGVDPLPGTVGYLTGDDPSRWHTGVPTYVGLVARSVYPGVDLDLADEGGLLEETFTVAAGADPELIRLDAGGGVLPSLDAAGDLLLAVPGATVVVRAPVAGQLVDGDHRTVPAAFALGPGADVRLTIGRHDPSRPLSVGLVLDDASRVHGGRLGYATAVATDLDGNAYVTGAMRALGSGGVDAGVLVARLDRHGQLLYEDHLRGGGDDVGLGIAVDRSGDAYVTGRTTSADFPTRNAQQPGYRGGGDAFVTRLDRLGGLVYSTYLGGHDYDQANAIAVDHAGDAYVTGLSFSSDFPRRPGASTQESAFAVRLDPAGRIGYVALVGGPQSAAGDGIAVDPHGDAFVAGVSEPADGDGGGTQAFATRLDPGGRIVSTTRLPSGDGASATGVAVDADGDAWVTGTIRSASGAAQAFVDKVRQGGGVEYATSFGGGGEDIGLGITLDRLDAAHVTGESTSPGGGRSVLVATVDDNGRLLSSTRYTRGDDDVGLGIAFDGYGVVVAGQTARRAPPGAGHSAAEVDVLVARLWPPAAEAP